MRPFLISVLWAAAGRRRPIWHSRAWRSPQGVQARPFSPLQGFFHLLWSIFWICFGLAMAFSPEFRSGFVELCVAFARLMAELARAAAAAIRPI